MSVRAPDFVAVTTTLPAVPAARLPGVATPSLVPAGVPVTSRLSWKEALVRVVFASETLPVAPTRTLPRARLEAPRVGEARS